ncbi:Os09g0462850, partial [Oryza sativa Japonica Group]
TAQSTQAPATTGAAARCDAAQSSKVVVTFTQQQPQKKSPSIDSLADLQISQLHLQKPSPPPSTLWQPRPFADKTLHWTCLE